MYAYANRVLLPSNLSYASAVFIQEQYDVAMYVIREPSYKQLHIFQYFLLYMRRCKIFTRKSSVKS